jgi:ABC-2 type transport system permease protein
MLPAMLVLFGAIAAGASMVGAEWQAGSYVTLLTWEPRRVRLMLARLTVNALVGFVLGVAMLTLFTVAVWPAAVRSGGVSPAGDWWVTYGGALLRLGGLTALAAVAGGALAMIGKRTVIAVFAVGAYLIAGEVVVRLYVSKLESWLVLRNMALALGGDELVPGGGSARAGARALLAWTAVVVVLAAVLFGRRDFVSAG